jgi:hypothetical protein
MAVGVHPLLEGMGFYGVQSDIWSIFLHNPSKLNSGWKPSLSGG